MVGNKESIDSSKVHNVAEMLADRFLKENSLTNTFCGAGLELIVQKQGIHLMYKSIEDQAFYGMSATGKGNRFIGINTFHNKRTITFSIACGLWYFYSKTELPDDLNYSEIENEQAADHFATALLLPEDRVETIYLHNKRDGWGELDILFLIADLSYCPYQAVYHRFIELELSIREIETHLKDPDLRTDKVLAENALENKFIHLRSLYGRPSKSPLDYPEKMNGFPGLMHIMKELTKE